MSTFVKSDYVPKSQKRFHEFLTKQLGMHIIGANPQFYVRQLSKANFSNHDDCKMTCVVGVELNSKGQWLLLDLSCQGDKFTILADGKGINELASALLWYSFSAKINPSSSHDHSPNNCFNIQELIKMASDVEVYWKAGTAKSKPKKRSKSNENA